MDNYLLLMKQLRMILNEGSRDNLLIPIINIYKEKTGKDVSVSAMKQYILAKLVNEANIRNLSMDSNYYLAGAARYYVNGDLTTNKKLNIFDESQTDVFNREICQKLNALILVLRNSYIDSIGTQWEQPEDFGTLPINKLLRKYGAAINKVLGIAPKKRETQPKEEEVIDFRVGNKGYTFDILYTFDDARKYNKATEPGAWCITYGEQHFKSYMRNYHGHFVIFLKDGYEKVPRIKEDNMWKGNKPQDTYGNSMIALLQRNTDGTPVLITSRWNHGANGIYCEADHAYTPEEFYEVVGITKNDLDRIQKIWQKHVSNTESSTNEERRRLNAERLEALRYLKYCQIKMNGGNKDPFGEVCTKSKVLTNKLRISDINKRYFDEAQRLKVENPNITREEMDFLQDKYNKEFNKVKYNSIRAVELNINDKTYGVMIDGNKIIFETLCECDGWDSIEHRFSSSIEGREGREDSQWYSKGDGFNELVYCEVINGIMLYSTRRHSFVEVEGVKKFKYVSTIYNNLRKEKNPYYEVAMSSTQIALIEYFTNQPVVLPNGHSWCEKISSEKFDYRANLNLKEYYTGRCTALNMVYDYAARERYIFDLQVKKFITVDPEKYNASYVWSEYLPNPDGVVVVGLESQAYNSTKYLLYVMGEKVTIDGDDEFHYVRRLSYGNYFLKSMYNEIFIVNFKNNKIFRDFPPIPNGSTWGAPNNYNYEDKVLILFPINARREGSPYFYTVTNYIWDNVNMKFVKNPFTGEYTIKATNTNDKKTEIYDDKRGSFIPCAYNVQTGEFEEIEENKATSSRGMYENKAQLNEVKEIDKSKIEQDFLRSLVNKNLSSSYYTDSRRDSNNVKLHKMENGITKVTISAISYTNSSREFYKFIDVNGNYLHDEWMSDAEPPSRMEKMGNIKVRNLEGKQNILTSDLNLVLPKFIPSVTRYGNWFIIECLEQNRYKCNLLDEHYNLVFDEWYDISIDDSLDEFSEFLIVSHNNKYNIYYGGLKRFLLKNWVDDVYHVSTMYVDTLFYIVHDQGKYNLLDALTGNLIFSHWLDCEPSPIYGEDSGELKVTLCGKQNVYDCHHKTLVLSEWVKHVFAPGDTEVSNEEFDGHSCYHKDFYLIAEYDNGKFNYIDFNGDKWFNFDFDNYWGMPNVYGISLIEINGKWNFYLRDGSTPVMQNAVENVYDAIRAYETYDPQTKQQTSVTINNNENPIFEQKIRNIVKEILKQLL